MSAPKPPVVVAVVEDDAPARTALGCLLIASGFEPAFFASAEACLDASPAPTCILVDVQPSGMSGIELRRAAARRRPGGTDHRDDR